MKRRQASLPIIALAILWLLGAITIVIAVLFFLPSKPATKPKAGVASDKARAAHQYHGILHSWVEQDGVAYFLRDGQKCRLYTEGFLARYGETQK